MTPATIDNRYVIVRELSRGTYLADDLSLNRPVALRIGATPPPPDLMRRLDHPGIVPVHDTGRLPEGTPYYTTNLVEGESLAQLIEAGAPLDRMLDVLTSAAEILAAAHDRGVVHGPLLPSHVVVSPSKFVHVLDWDGAQAVPPGDPMDDVVGLGGILRVMPVGARLAAVARRACGRRHPSARAFLRDLDRARQDRNRTRALFAPLGVAVIVAIGAVIWTVRAEQRRLAQPERAGPVEDAASGRERVLATLDSAQGLVDEAVYSRGTREDVLRILARVREKVDEALRLIPDLPEALALRAEIREEEGEDAPAEADWREAVRLAPQRAVFRSRLGRHLLGRSILAMLRLQKRDHVPAAEAKEDADALRTEALQFIAGSRADAEPMQARISDVILISFQKDKREEALALARDSIAKHRAEPSGLEWMHLLIAYLSAGEERRNALDECLQVRSHFMPARMMRAADFLRSMSWKAAVVEFDGILELRPGWGLAYLDRGLARMQYGEFVEAIRDFDRGLALEPDRLAGWINRGYAKLLLKDDDGALADYNEALRRRPGLPDALLNRGMLYNSRGKCELAIADFEEVLRGHPNDALAYSGRGDAYARMNRLDDALADHNRAVELCPSDPDILLSRSWVLRRKRDLAGAIADLEKALTIASSYWPSRKYAEERLKEYRALKSR